MFGLTNNIWLQSKCRVSDILKVGCQDTRIAQSSLFGIAIRVPSEGLGGDSPRNEYLFLNPDHLLHKYIGKRSKLPWVSFTNCRFEPMKSFVIHI